MNSSPIAFSFGEPESVLDTRDIIYEGVWMAGNGRYFEPPIPLNILARSYRIAWHGSAIQVKRNILVSLFIPSPLLSREQFAGLALDYLIFGNAYLEEVRGRLGRRLGFRRRLAKYMRRAVDLDTYWWAPDFYTREEIPAGRIIHLLEPSADQEVYGEPDYIGSLQSAWLNESATLFRRRYYANGSHAGFILYLSEPSATQEDADKLREELRKTKGIGNFRNLFFHAPNGKKDGIQVIPIAEVAAKDEFWNLKNVTRDDQLAGHRIPPQLLGVVPTNSAGFGDVEKAARVFVVNELEPLQRSFEAVNELAGEPVISFRPYPLAEPAAKSAAA